MALHTKKIGTYSKISLKLVSITIEHPTIYLLKYLYKFKVLIAVTSILVSQIKKISVL